MKATTLTLVLTLAPAALFAQASGAVKASSQGSASTQGKQGSASASADASADVQAPRDWSAESRTKLDAMYTEARAQKLPVRPIARRVAEGRAKGAAEATILTSAAVTKANLSATQEAMVSAGRTHPTDAEIERGAHAMERGVTNIQIEALVRHAPADRSLVVAFDVLAKLTARGVPVTEAVAQVQSKIDARASDAAITALAAGSIVRPTSAATVNANMAGQGTAKSVAGSAAATVTGTVKKP